MGLETLTPGLLFGAALIAVPIVIHLILKKKPKHMLFPAFQLLQRRHRTNLQKLRLRHILLLAMRILLILLMCFALAQPEVIGEGAGLPRNTKIGLILIFDTSPSMDYRAGGKDSPSLLDTAKKRTEEMLQELPPGSQVAVLDSATEPGALYRGDVKEAIPAVKELPANTQVTITLGDDSQAKPFNGNRDAALAYLEKLPTDRLVVIADAAAGFKNKDDALLQVKNLRMRPSNRPVTLSLLEAYQMLTAAPPDLPTAIVVISDRTAESWSKEQVKRDLVRASQDAQKKLKLDKPVPAVYFDLTPGELRNVAITGVQKKGHRSATPLEDIKFGVSAEEALQLAATVEVTGMNLDAELILTMDGQEMDRQRVRINVPPGQSKTEVFTFRDLRVTGLHRGEVRLANLTQPDPVELDNVRYWTVLVPKRKALIIADTEDDITLLEAALSNLTQMPLACDYLPPAQAGGALDPDKYQVVCLLNVAKPGAELWEALRKYAEVGGGLLLLPGETADKDDYASAAAAALMPAPLVAIREFPRPKGVILDPEFNHPIMLQFRDWERRNLPAWKAWRLWEVNPDPNLATTVVKFNNGLPALLERRFADRQKTKGRVILFTTSMYRTLDSKKDWNNYHEGWFFPGITFATVRHLLGAREEAQNYLLGQNVTLWLPRNIVSSRYSLIGKVAVNYEVKQGQENLVVREASWPGNYRVAGPADGWQRGFSVNLPAAETNLSVDRPSAADLEGLLGEKSVQPLPTEGSLLEPIQARLGQSPRTSLLPYLMIAVLFLLAFENLLANRFYRRDPETPD